jgi:hypothetical protein
MANEITMTARLEAAKNSSSVTQSVYAKTQNMQTTKTLMSTLVQTIPTSRTTPNLGSVDITNATGTEYMVLFQNRDATNFVTVEVQTGSSTYQSVGVMRPGESWGPARLPKLDGSGYGGLRVTADTAACDVQITAVQAGNPAT